jgi:hypothetical protein
LLLHRRYSDRLDVYGCGHLAEKASCWMKFRFTLKKLFYVMTLVAIWLGWRHYVEVESADSLRAYHEVRTLMDEGRFGECYFKMMSEEYRAAHSQREFRKQFAPYQASKGSSGHDPNASVRSLRFSSASIYERASPGFFELLSGQCWGFRKKDGKWWFTGGNKYIF